MREIKFKLYSSETNEYITTVTLDNIPLVIQQEIHTGKLIPAQYTGLKDKNGKEIYEGDIIDYMNMKFVQKNTKKQNNL